MTTSALLPALPRLRFTDTPFARFIGMFFMIVGCFMATLDIQIISSSLTTIQAAIGAGADEVSWVQTSYLVAEVVMVPLSAWLTDVFSIRWLFVLSCGSFTLTSLGCALAWDTTSMIVFRVLQGFLGGAMIPLAFASVYKLFPPKYQAGATMAVSIVPTVAPALGPSIGGWLTDHFSWQWLFLINIPPGALAMLVVGFLVRVDRPNWGLIRRMDLPGIILVAIGLGSLQVVLERGQREDWFDASYIVFFTWAAVISLILLLWRELTIANPVIELRVFKDRNLAVGCGFSFLVGVIYYGQSFSIPILLATVAGYNSLQIGETIGVTGLGMFIGAAIGVPMAAKMELRVMLAIGIVIGALSYWLNGFLTPAVGFDELIVPQILRGISIIIIVLPVAELTLGTLPDDYVRQGSAMFNVFRNGGGAVGIALISVTFNNQENRDYWLLRGHLTPDRLNLPALHGMINGIYGTHIADHAATVIAGLKQLQTLALTQSIVMGWNDTFQIFALWLFVPIIFVPLLRRSKPGRTAQGH